MKILLAVDGSEESQRAVEVIRSRTWPADTTVRVFSVSQTAFAFASAMAPAGVLVEQLSLQLEAGAKQAVEGAMTSLKSSGLVLESRVGRGDPRTEIVEEAKEWGCDLIVMGSHGHTGLQRWILGSVAEYVVRHAPCSVEIARGAVSSPGWGATTRGSRPITAP